MRQRCLNPKSRGWEYYGGNTPPVTICERWLGSEGFKNFLADLGRRPAGKTLDRKNPFGNYEPGNCQWAGAPWQAQNKRAHYTPEEQAELERQAKEFIEGDPVLAGDAF